jgi:hypothetical protein
MALDRLLEACLRKMNSPAATQSGVVCEQVCLFDFDRHRNKARLSTQKSRVISLN